MPDSQNLKRRPGRIRQGTKQVKCGVHAELTPHLCDAGRRPVKKWRKHKTDSVLVETTLHGFGRSSGVDAQRFEHVGAAGMRCCSVRAMFRNRQTGASDDKSCRRRDVESFHRARTGSRGVDETFVFGVQSKW